MAVFRSVTPEVEPLSLDEAFLDVSGAIRRLGPPGRIGELIRARIARRSRASPARSGWPPTKFVAKLASARCKPDGLLVVPADGVLGFLHPLPVAALWGVGEQTGQRAGPARPAHRRRPRAHCRWRRWSARSARPPARTCTRWPGAATSARSSPGVPDKCIGAEETFATDVDDPEVIRRELLRLSGRTARGLRAAGAVARTVAVKLRLADFTTITRSRTLPEPTDVAREIYATACALYDGGRA